MRFIRAAIRFILFLFATLGLYGFWWLASFFVPNKVRWRQVIFYAWTKSFAVLSGMKIEVKGTPPQPPFFLVSNHLSYTDIAAIRAVATGIFVAKYEVSQWPVIGKIVSDMGTIFINRQNRRDIPRAGKVIIDRLSQGEAVIVFPEGTSTKGETIIPFNSSFLQFAAEGNVPVSYCSVSYRTDSDGPPASARICWWEDIGFLKHIWRHLQLKKYTAIISFGDSPITNPDRKLLAAELRDRVEAIFTPVL